MINTWVECPKCKSFRCHYIKEKYQTYLGHFLSQESSVTVQYYGEDYMPWEPNEYLFFDRQKYAIHIERECIECGHTWYQLHEELVI